MQNLDGASAFHMSAATVSTLLLVKNNAANLFEALEYLGSAFLRLLGFDHCSDSGPCRTFASRLRPANFGLAGFLPFLLRCMQLLRMLCPTPLVWMDSLHQAPEGKENLGISGVSGKQQRD